MTFNFDAAPGSHGSTPHQRAACRAGDRVVVENDETVLALEREIASEVLVVSSTG
jgi:hypothetical protein